MGVRRVASCSLLVAALVAGGAACSGSSDDSGAVTNIDEVGPQLAKLRLEVESLRAEVRALREQVATFDPAAVATSTTAPLR